ncbi:hypothetical protein ACF07Y_38860 [Streptomyces sp. NPDC016566]|uniref:hypothetical protein n=1 Tax=Streptomyces sp. NPDC016566 TaxID=3364967 RepID=UPI003701D274
MASRSRGRNSEVLARRKAALERAASRMAGERRAAAQAEAERLRQEEAFDELAADFELAVQDEQTVAAEVEEEVRRVRERGRVRIDEVRVAAARVVLAMGEAGETVAGCGRRLGVGVERVKELRRLGREAAGGADAGEAAPKGSGKSPGKVRGPERAVDELRAERRESSRAAGPAAAEPAGRAAGPAPGMAPVTPPVPVAAPLVTPAVGPSGAPGPVGGARPEWRE